MTETKSVSKYPRTMYLPFSLGIDDKSQVTKVNLFIKQSLVVTVKLDGSNVKLTRDYVAARNGRFAEHASFDMLKQLHAAFKHKIPDNVDIYGEWMYAKHSIHYKEHNSLNSFLYIFAAYDRDSDTWYSWNSVEDFAKQLGFPTVKVVDYVWFKDGAEATKTLMELAKMAIDNDQEGIVVRRRAFFKSNEFAAAVGKVVRPNHVTDSKHWRTVKLVRNEINAKCEWC